MSYSRTTTSTAHRRIENALYRKSVLENGIRVVTETIPHVRSVSIGVWANVGSRDEDGSRNGISHFLEHMVFKGTRKRSVRDIAQSLEALGGYMNAFTTKEQTCFYARVLDAHLDQAVDVLSDIILNATFREGELEKEKLVVIEELRNAEDDPEDIIHDYFEKSIFPNHPLGYPIIGTEANLRAFKRGDLRSHVQEHYQPSRMVVAAAGNVDHDLLVRLVRKYFRSLKFKDVPYRRAHAPGRRDSASTAEIPRPISQAHVCLGTIACSITNPARYALMVANALLGEGMSSRLYQTIREKHGYAYSVYSFVSLLSDTGVFGTYVGTDKTHVKDVIELVHRELSKLKLKPVSASELRRTKSQIKGTMMLGLENMSGRMIRLGSSELYLESYMSLDETLTKIDAVSPDDIQAVANDVFQEDRFSTVVIRPA